jgi:ABC-type branched-subunit amino acid transport system substrate-binding protein
MTPTTRVVALGAAVVLAAAAGCSSKAADADSVPGVTDDTITLGALIDLSGPLSGSGKMTVKGIEMAMDEINAEGGVCGRDLELEVRDTAYDVQKAVVAYGEIEDEVLGMRSVYGSAVVNAVLNRIHDSKMLMAPTSFAGSLLDDPNLVVFGPTFGTMVINGLEFLSTKGDIKPGDKIGHIYLEGEVGVDSLAGSTFYADRHDMEVVGIQVKATDTDLRGQVQQLADAGVTAIISETTPSQVASVAAVSESVGLRVPIISGPQGFGRSLLDTNAGRVLEKRFYKMSGVAPMGADTPEMSDFRERFQAENEEPESGTGVIDAYVMTNVYVQMINEACDDLTRDGLLEARTKLADFQQAGMTPVEDFSDISVPSSAESMVLGVDPAAYSGLEVVQGFTASPTATEYLAQASQD